MAGVKEQPLSSQMLSPPADSNSAGGSCAATPIGCLTVGYALRVNLPLFQQTTELRFRPLRRTCLVCHGIPCAVTSKPPYGNSLTLDDSPWPLRVSPPAFAQQRVEHGSRIHDSELSGGQFPAGFAERGDGRTPNMKAHPRGRAVMNSVSGGTWDQVRGY